MSCCFRGGQAETDNAERPVLLKGRIRITPVNGPAKGAWKRACEFARVKCIREWFYPVTYLTDTCRTCRLMPGPQGVSRTVHREGRPGGSLTEEAVPDREADQRKYGKTVQWHFPRASQQRVDQACGGDG